MNRRTFLCGLALGTLSTPLVAGAQQPAKAPRIAFLSQRPVPSIFSEAFRQGLRDLGYTEGQNIVLELRGTDRYERLRQLAAELVDLRPDVFVVHGTAGTEAARAATSTIPIVGVALFDPVEAGLVASLARPGGNITGLSLVSLELEQKRLQLLKETVPNVSRVTILWLSGDPFHPRLLKQVQGAAAALGVSFRAVEVHGPDGLDQALSATTKEPVDALLPLASAAFSVHRRSIIAFCAKFRLPLMSHTREWVADGALLAYGPDYPDQFRRAASYTDKILKGARPADLPVEQPTKFEFVINLKTAKALGLTISQSVLGRADHVIE
jgi:putative ABC transport system substrate-binding protein